MKDSQTQTIVQSSENIFEDLGFALEEAANLKVRADLMLDLKKYINDREWTQEKAADFFGEAQSQISQLMNGEIERFSIDQLINMLAKAGMKVKVEVIPEFVPQK
ncbi:MAG: helix-turn-helix transcriptional regulator [Cyanobacteriota bacterium]|nr:helix-turn-helix transcriptional regulator [Cyanobacteriota bacterium]